MEAFMRRLLSLALFCSLLCVVVTPQARADGVDYKQARLRYALIMAGLAPARADLLMAGLSNVWHYDTAAELLADSVTDSTIGYAIDTDALYLRANGAWVAIASSDGLLGSNGGTIDNETNNVWTFSENSEDLTLTAGTDLWTFASSTGATVAITPATAVAGALAANGGITVDTSNFTVDGTTGAVATASTLGVADTAALDGGITVDTTNFTVDGTTGAVATASTLGVTGLTTATGGVALGTSSALTATVVSVDFTVEHQVPWFAKGTGAIMTEADTQEDYFRVGPLGTYFEVFQDGNNTDFAGTWGDGVTGWVMPGPNAADQGFQLTEGIVLGSAHSFTAQTDTMLLRVAFLINVRAELADLMIGFRALGAYAVADDATEMATAYDDKVFVGIDGNAGVIKQMTSVATVDVTTACTATAAADGDILMLQVAVDAAGDTTVSVGAATPAGGTTAQTQAAVATALGALTEDVLCNGASVTLTAGEYVPTIAFAKAANGTVSTNVLTSYYSGAQ
jgi:hypothetical protein